MSDPLIGRVLAGAYRVERPLGAGGMGTVYAAVHLSLARPVALKVLNDVSDAVDLARLRTEALAAASLAHPHVVNVSDFVEPRGGDPAFLVMELLAGRSLASVLAERGALTSATATHVALQILDALGAAHAAGILHRDVKPANVMVLDGNDRERPWIKLVDFGIAKIDGDAVHRTATGAIVGTPAYMAPEVLAGARATTSSDLYAVGACLYEMLTGRRAYVGRAADIAAEIARGVPPDVDLLRAEGGTVAEPVLRAMHRDPRERFANAREMADALRAASSTTIIDEPPREAAPLHVAPRRRWPLFAASFAVTALLGSVGTIGLVLRGRGDRSNVVSSVDAAGEPLQATTVADAPSVPSEDASSDTDARDEAGAGRTVDRAAAAKVLSYCVDDHASPRGHDILCTFPVVYACECLSPTSGDVYEGPALSSRALRREVTTRIDGEPCNGFGQRTIPGTNTTESYPRQGTFRCHFACNNPRQKASARLAIPGTRCTGWLFDETITSGTWRAVSPR